MRISSPRILILFVLYFLYSREESPAQAIIITFIDMSGLGRYHNRHNMLYIYVYIINKPYLKYEERKSNRALYENSLRGWWGWWAWLYLCTFSSCFVIRTAASQSNCIFQNERWREKWYLWGNKVHNIHDDAMLYVTLLNFTQMMMTTTILTDVGG